MFVTDEYELMFVFVKFTVVGDRVKPAGATPVPVSVEVSGELVAFDVTVKKPDCAPAVDGWNVTEMLQDPAEASGEVHVLA